MTEGLLKVRQLMTQQVVSVDPDATVAEAITRLEQNGIHELPVMKGSELRGWFSYRLLRRRGGPPGHAKIATVMDPPRRIEKDADVLAAAQMMILNNVQALSVTDGKGKVVGLLSRTDLLQAALGVPSIADLGVESVMNSELEVAREGESVDQVLGRLRDLHINQLLVVDGNGRLQGFVGLDQLAKLHTREHSAPAPERARGGTGGMQGPGERRSPQVEIKSLVREAPTVLPTARVRDAIEAMQRAKSHFVVVVEDRRALGVLSRSNVVERLARLRPEPGVLCQIVGLADHVDAGVLEGIHALAASTLKKVAPEVNTLFLSLHYKVYKDKAKNGGGGDSKYAVACHLSTDQKFFVAKADAWDPIEATNAALDILEMRVADARERRLERRKGPGRRKAEFYTAAETG